MTPLEEASAICGEIAELRHAIHREPEIGHDLPRTRDKVLAARRAPARDHPGQASSPR